MVRTLAGASALEDLRHDFTASRIASITRPGSEGARDVAAVGVVDRRTHALRNEMPQVRVQGVVVLAQDVPARLRPPRRAGDRTSPCDSRLSRCRRGASAQMYTSPATRSSKTRLGRVCVAIGGFLRFGTIRYSDVGLRQLPTTRSRRHRAFTRSLCALRVGRPPRRPSGRARRACGSGATAGRESFEPLRSRSRISAAPTARWCRLSLGQR
jgi:hypothetical protein